MQQKKWGGARAYHVSVCYFGSVCPAAPGRASAVSWTFCWHADAAYCRRCWNAAAPVAYAPIADAVGDWPTRSHLPAVDGAPRCLAIDLPRRRVRRAIWRSWAANAVRCRAEAEPGEQWRTCCAVLLLLRCYAAAGIRLLADPWTGMKSQYVTWLPSHAVSVVPTNDRRRCLTVARAAERDNMWDSYPGYCSPDDYDDVDSCRVA